jgi:hypothetical protein
MAAGLGFKTFAVGEVLSAANVNGYLMQGVLVFADATARDASITSPQEGQFAYLKDTNVTTYYTGSAWANLDTTGMTNPMTTTGDTVYSSSGSTPARLGIGTAGQVLRVNSGATAPEWATPSAASSGLVFIQSATVSAAASLSMDSVFTSTYQNYLIVGDFDGSTDATVRIRFRTSASDNTTANYNYAVFFNPNSGSLSGAGGATADDNGKFANHGSSGTCYFSATILNPQVSEQTGWLSNGYRFSSARTDHFGNFSATTAFDGFKLYPDSGTFTGTVRLYGLANS